MMSDEEKFEGFKRDLIKENEEKYGREVRKANGEDAEMHPTKGLQV